MTRHDNADHHPGRFDINNLQPGKPDPSSKPSIDKLIDINHHLIRRVEELEEIVHMYMGREVRHDLNRMKKQEDS